MLRAMKCLVLIGVVLSLAACKGNKSDKSDKGGDQGEPGKAKGSSETVSKQELDTAVAAAVKGKYAVDMAIDCPDQAPVDKPVTCKGKLDGADVVLEYADGSFTTKSGVITAEGLQGQLEKMAEAQNSSLDGIDCGPTRLYGAAPGNTIECKLGPRTLTIEINADGSGIKIVGDEGGPPAAPAP